MRSVGRGCRAGLSGKRAKRFEDGYDPRAWWTPQTKPLHGKEVAGRIAP